LYSQRHSGQKAILLPPSHSLIPQFISKGFLYLEESFKCRKIKGDSKGGILIRVKFT
jgi:hypothetical protein